jgi:hypothetical protein
MKLIIFLFLLCTQVIAQSVWYFGSGEAVNLTNGMSFSNGLKVLSGSLDPSASAVNAPAGSIYQSTNGSVYVKQDAGNSTNWLPVGVAAPSSLSTINGQSGPGVTIATGSAGTDFAISASANTITLDIPTASAANRGLLSSANWTTFNNKEPAITATSSSDYYRGDKTFQPLNKSAVGLANVDNTSDANKPVSTATQTALDLKADLASPTFTGTVSGITKSMVGLANVDNTSDANKPVSTATQTALDLKQDIVAGVDSTEIGYLNGVTSGIQAQIDGKEPTITVLPLAKGGTAKDLSAAIGAGKLVYADADSFELLGAGTADTVLVGGTTPAWAFPSIKGSSDTTSDQDVRDIKVPNNQLTLQESAAGVYRIETGNNNLLSNPSFENLDSLLDGWTWTGDAITSASVSAVHGAASLLIEATSDSFTLSQSTTLNQSQFADGVQGLIGMWVKTDHTGACEVCAIQAGTPSTDDCVDVNADGKWGHYRVYPIFGATSNGLQLSCASGTGDTYVDGVDLGTPEAPLQASGVCTTKDCMDEFTWRGGSTGTVANEKIDIVNGDGVLSDTSLFTYTFNSDSFTVAPNCSCTAGPGASSNLHNCQIETVSTTAVAVRTNRSIVAGSTSAVALAHTVTCEKQGADVLAAESKSKGAIYTASCGVNCEDTFSARITSAGAVTSESGDWVSGVSVSTAQHTITFTTGIFTVAPACIAVGAHPSDPVGVRVDSTSSTTLVLDTFNTSSAGDIARGYNVICQKQGVDKQFSKVIHGTFNETVKVKGTTKSGLYAATGTCSSSSSISDQIGGTATSISNVSSGQCNIVLPASIFGNASNAFCSADFYGALSSANGRWITTVGNTTTQIGVDCTTQGSGGTPADCTTYGFSVLCLGEVDQ